jgi:hypothetical protein
MICCGFAIQPPPCNGRRTLNGNAAPDPGGKNIQPGDVFEQLPTPGTAEFRDIRTWHRWAADFRIVTEGHFNDRERKRGPSWDGYREEE